MLKQVQHDGIDIVVRASRWRPKRLEYTYGGLDSAARPAADPIGET
jgi:hypothetical protein